MRRSKRHGIGPVCDPVRHDWRLFGSPKSLRLSATVLDVVVRHDVGELIVSVPFAAASSAGPQGHAEGRFIFFRMA